MKAACVLLAGAAAAAAAAEGNGLPATTKAAAAGPKALRAASLGDVLLPPSTTTTTTTAAPANAAPRAPIRMQAGNPSPALFGSAQVKTYAKLKSLLQAADNGEVGEVFMLASGEYREIGEYTINAHGVTIMAKHPGKVVIRPHSAGLRIIIAGHNNTVSGLQFVDGAGVSGKALIEVTGSHNTLTNLNFYNMDATHYVKFVEGSHKNTLSYSNIEYRPALAAVESGALVVVESSATVPGHHVISRCGIHAIPGSDGAFGMEPIKIGSEHDHIGRNVVEYMVFNGTGLGTAESVAVRCGQNVVRYSTFTNNNNAMLSFLGGDYNAAYGNWFMGAGGFSIGEANNLYIYNNYFQSAGTDELATSPLTFVGPVTSTDAVTGQPVYAEPSPEYKNNVVVAHNTFLECQYINLGWVATDKNAYFVNNLLKRSDGNIFAGISSPVHFSGNAFSGALGASLDNTYEPSEFSEVSDAMLFDYQPAYGYYAPGPTSAAIGAAGPFPPDESLPIFDIPDVDDDPYLQLDITGRPRPAVGADAGCAQYYETDEGIFNRPLTPDDVGPDYIMSYYPTMQPTALPVPVPADVPTVSPIWDGGGGDEGEDKDDNDSVDETDAEEEDAGEDTDITFWPDSLDEDAASSSSSSSSTASAGKGKNLRGKATTTTTTTTTDGTGPPEHKDGEPSKAGDVVSDASVTSAVAAALAAAAEEGQALFGTVKAASGKAAAVKEEKEEEEDSKSQSQGKSKDLQERARDAAEDERLWRQREKDERAGAKAAKTGKKGKKSSSA